VVDRSALQLSDDQPITSWSAATTTVDATLSADTAPGTN